MTMFMFVSIITVHFGRMKHVMQHLETQLDFQSFTPNLTYL